MEVCVCYLCRRVLSWCQFLSWTTTSPLPATTWLRCWMSTRQSPTLMWSWLVGHKDKHTLCSDTWFSAAQCMFWGSRSTLADIKLLGMYGCTPGNKAVEVQTYFCTSQVHKIEEAHFMQCIFEDNQVSSKPSPYCAELLYGDPKGDLWWDTPCNNTAAWASGIDNMLW